MQLWNNKWILLYLYGKQGHSKVFCTTADLVHATPEDKRI